MNKCWNSGHAGRRVRESEPEQPDRGSVRRPFCRLSLKKIGEKKKGSYCEEENCPAWQCAPALNSDEATRVLVSLQHVAPSTDQPQPTPLRVADLGWTQEQAADTRARLASFAEDWDAPGMEGYDDR